MPRQRRLGFSRRSTLQDLRCFLILPCASQSAPESQQHNRRLRISQRRLAVDPDSLCNLPAFFERLPEVQIVFGSLRPVFFDGRRQLRDSLDQIAFLLHLRDSQVQIVFRRMRQGSWIIQNHAPAICVFPLRSLGQQIARRLSALDVMVRHNRMYDILRAPLRHVATRAISRSRMSARIDLLRQSRRVALEAYAVVMAYRRFAPRRIVRIVASRAHHPAITFQEASRAPQTISRTDQFELVVTTRFWRVVEIQNERAQRLSGLVGKRPPLVSPNRIRQGKAGRLQMARHAQFHLTLSAQPRRIYNRTPDRLAPRSTRRKARMPETRTVAT